LYKTVQFPFINTFYKTEESLLLSINKPSVYTYFFNLNTNVSAWHHFSSTVMSPKYHIYKAKSLRLTYKVKKNRKK